MFVFRPSLIIFYPFLPRREFPLLPRREFPLVLKLSVAGPPLSVCVSRFLLSTLTSPPPSDFQKTANVFAALEHLFPTRYKADILEFEDETTFKAWAAKDLVALLKLGKPPTEDVLTWVDDARLVGGAQAGLQFARELTGDAAAPSPSSALSKASFLAAEPSDDAKYDFDAVVIGGGSGGLAFSKRAARLGATVALLDFVRPSPQGTKWGLGGTCVNVGCIPKKLFHTAALLGESFHAAKFYGFGDEEFNAWPKHNWERAVQAVQDHIHSLNFGYRVQLREDNIKYINKLGTFVDAHTLEAVDAKGNKELIRAKRFLVAVGGRPKPLGCPGEELAVSSDDLFSLPEAPGKTLVVGASYVALECAGFLKGLGLDVAVMVRSILLRGFDRDMSDRVGAYMEKHGTRFIRDAQPTKLERVISPDPVSGAPKSMIRVFWGTTGVFEDFETVVAAIGRDPDTKLLGLDKAGVKIDAKTGKLQCTDERTNVPHIYALGDVLLGRPELTPVAIQAGKLLADRLYAGGQEFVDYDNVCTTVFTPLEYSCVGWSEDHAKEMLGDDALDVYHTHFIPLEWTVSHGEPNDCYLKVLVDLSSRNRVVGIHYLGPNAGEVMMGYGVAFRMGLTFGQLTSTIGIHPTCAEEFTLVNVTKRSGKSAEKTGC